MRFQLFLKPEDEARFREQKLRELLLTQMAADGDPPALASPAQMNIPNYVQVEERA